MAHKARLEITMKTPEAPLNASLSASLEVPRRPDRIHNSRIWRVAGAVLLAHVALLWAMGQAWLEQVSTFEEAQVIMASVMVESPIPPAPQPKPQPQPKSVSPALPPPRPTAVPLPTLSKQAEASPSAPVVAPVVAPIIAAANSAPATPSAPAAAPSASVGKPALPSLVLPSSDADYLNNPPPAYPRISKRMGEQGTVIVRVFIGLQGTAEQAEIRTSSGYDRLDKAALDTVQRWRYVPGKRHGNPEAMWFNVPVRFVLE
jgi:periplasmic protein TonB